MVQNDLSATFNALLCAGGSVNPDVLPSRRLATSAVDISFSVAAYGHVQCHSAGVSVRYLPVLIMGALSGPTLFFLSVLVAVRGNVARLVDHLRR